MDRSLDDIISERPRGGGRSRPDRRGPPRAPRAPRDREEYPRDGVRKNRRDDHANIDGDWVHDRYDDNDRRRRGGGGRAEDYDYDRRAPAGRAMDDDGTRLRVENLHYELTEDDVNELFNRIGPLASCKMLYDRGDRSLGTAFVTYLDPRDAREAIRQFDGANANGQPIRLSLLPPTSGRRDGQAPGGSLFDRVSYPSRSLEERINRDDDDMPRRRGGGGRQDRSHSPRKGGRNGGLRAPDDVDRYMPGGRGGRDSRSPLPGGGRPRERGRRPGERSERGGRGGRRGGRVDDEGRPIVGGRPKKTAEELDAEMADYFGGGGGTGDGETAAAGNGQNGGSGPAAATGGNDDIDMIE